MNRARNLIPTALGWIREDLDKLVERVRLQVESIAANPGSGKAVVTDTLASIDELQAIFEVLQLEGARQVLEELQTLCAGLSAAPPAKQEAVAGLALDALATLPAYLDRLQAGHHDLPLLLLPLINRLREANGSEPLTEGTLFTPLLDVELPELELVRRPGYDEPWEYFTGRMLRQYESALQDWLQNPSDPALLSPLQAICETMRHRMLRYDLKRMWWVATEVVGGLMEGHVANDVHLRRILARLGLVIKSSAEGDENAYGPELATSVTQALLFHVTRARRGCAGLDLVYERFQLDRLAPGSEAMERARGTLAGRDRDMYRSLSAAVQDELALVKNALDLELRTGRVDADSRVQSLEAIRRLADTLRMLGLAAPAQLIADLLPEFESNAEAERATRDQGLIRLAERLLLAESALNEQIETLGEPVADETGEHFIALPRHEQKRIIMRLLEECVVSMHEAEEAVRERLAGDGEADADAPLEIIEGAMVLAGDARAARACARLRVAVAELLGRSKTSARPPKAEVEALADALAALELYFAAARDQQADASRLWRIMQERLDQLESGELRSATVAPATSAGTASAAPPIRVPVTTPITSAGPTAHAGGSAHAGAQAMNPPAPATAPPAAPTPGPAKTVPAATVTAPAPVQKVKDGDRLPEHIDPELRDIFLEEYEAVTETLHDAIPRWMNRLDDVTALTEVRRAFHTLKGSGRMVGAEELGEFAWQIEDMLNALLEGRNKNFAEISLMLRLAQASLPALRQRLLQEPTSLTRGLIELLGRQAQGLGRGTPCDWEGLRAALPLYLATILPVESGGQAAQREAAAGKDAAGFSGELETNLQQLREFLEQVTRERTARITAPQLQAAAALARALASRQEHHDHEIAASLSRWLKLQAATGAPFSNASVWILASAIGQLQSRLERELGQGEPVAAEEQEALLAQIASLMLEIRAEGDQPPEPATETRGPALGTAAFDPGRSVFAGPATTASDVQAAVPPAARTPATPQPFTPPAAPPPPAALTTASQEEPDAEIMAIFLEEAGEVLERGDEALNSWRSDLHDLEWVRNLQREIHTFKGGARMAGLAGLGDYTHAMESLLERIANQLLTPSVSAVQVLEEACDRLHGWVEQVTAGLSPDIDAAFALLSQQIEALESVPLPGGIAPAITAALTPREIHELTEPAVPEADRSEAREDNSGPGSIRVSADLLDRLVNAAGEVSIFRARLEQQMQGLRANLSEFDETTQRLREQFRKLEIEIETRIRSSFPDTRPGSGDGFDPLELDEFSALQQVARGLSESVSDLLNLQEMLGEGARSSEKLLMQQARVSHELQEGLMKTRMVPFASIAPRLRRVVRGATKDTGKEARLVLRVAGSSDELDRNVLEHITVPLEHLMRNAIAHGIEAPARRRELGKDPEGEIKVTVESEATEFVIRIEDDGAGIDTQAIRERAIRQGLLAADANPTEHKLFEFILHSGFSTSSKVTSLAGRGVGMDVVNSDIKQIGGSLEIGSQANAGTRFTIRIPFTLAVMQAIGVVAGDQRYLLPLSSVVGVARMLPDDYRRLASEAAPVYVFAGRQYPVLDLEQVLGEQPRPPGRDNVSLLILRAGEQVAALRVPELLPHREIVIKPVGPQIGSVPGVLGGSISANGEVQIILDPGPLIRRALIDGLGPIAAADPAVTARRPLVMVVDDSITMRKVTSRVLEGVNFEVFTARDGVEALELLQDRVPDLMLLDIEMPRMDGYELTERVREDPRLSQIPIMMITSRAGQKHRDRASQAGANAYLTKPYREFELVAECKRLLGLEQGEA